MRNKAVLSVFGLVSRVGIRAYVLGLDYLGFSPLDFYMEVALLFALFRLDFTL